MYYPYQHFVCQSPGSLRLLPASYSRYIIHNLIGQCTTGLSAPPDQKVLLFRRPFFSILKLGIQSHSSPSLLSHHFVGVYDLILQDVPTRNYAVRHGLRPRNSSARSRLRIRTVRPIRREPTSSSRYPPKRFLLFRSPFPIRSGSHVRSWTNRSTGAVALTLSLRRRPLPFIRTAIP